MKWYLTLACRKWFSCRWLVVLLRRWFLVLVGRNGGKPQIALRRNFFLTEAAAGSAVGGSEDVSVADLAVSYAYLVATEVSVCYEDVCR